MRVAIPNVRMIETERNIHYLLNTSIIAAPKKLKKRYDGSKKYAHIHSSSDSETDKKRAFRRRSDDEYEPEKLKQSKTHKNYTAYYEESGKKVTTII